MKMQEHMAYGGVASVGAWYLWGPWSALVFWFSTVLIDSDHYLDQIIRTKGADWSVRNLFRTDAYYRRKLAEGTLSKDFLCFSVFHTIEAFALIYVVGLLSHSHFFFVVFSGMVFHLFLDYIWLVQNKCIFIRAQSFLEFFLRRRHMAARGLDPDGVQKQAYRDLGMAQERPSRSTINPPPQIDS